MDKKKDGNYGAHTIKDVSETCYGAVAIHSAQMARDHPLFKADIEKIVGEYLTKQVKDDIFNSFQSHMVDVDKESYSNAQKLVIDFLKIIIGEGSGKPMSETTELLETQDSTHELDVEQDLIHRKRRCAIKEDQTLHSSNSPDALAYLKSNEREPNQHKYQDAKNDNSPHRKVASTSRRDKSISLNHTPPEDDGPTSSVCKPEKEQANDGNTEPNSNQVDMNEVEEERDEIVTDISSGEIKKKALGVPSLACIAQEYGESDSKSSKHVSREDYLKEARKKYYFHDSSVPSFRVGEFHDDNGKYIDEPELRRPVGPASVHQYENNYMNGEELKLPLQINQMEENASYVCSPTKVKSPAFKPSEPSHPSSNKELTKRWNIEGRKLFQDHSDITPISKNQKLEEPMSSPEVEFLCEKLKTLFLEVQFLGERSNRLVATSPEVQYLGQNVFNNVCIDMSTRTDDLYNAGLTLGSSSSVSTGKENVPPKRVVKHSHFIRSPFENNTRSIIQPHEMIIYETITTLCDDPKYRDRWIINMNNCRVSLLQLGSSMKQNGWVKAWVINACCRKIFKDIHPRYSNKHFFFHTSAEYFLEKWPNEYMKNIWNKNVIKNFKAADSARKLHLSERLNFPALYDEHWFVFAVDMKTRNFIFLDSLYGETSALHQQVDNMLITNFRNTWNECNLKDMHVENFGRLFPNLPKQRTGNDCGVFTIKYMQKYCIRNPQSCSFSAEDIPESRVRIAVDTLFNDYNSEVEEMDFIRKFDL